MACRHLGGRPPSRSTRCCRSGCWMAVFMERPCPGAAPTRPPCLGAKGSGGSRPRPGRGAGLERARDCLAVEPGPLLHHQRLHGLPSHGARPARRPEQDRGRGHARRKPSLGRNPLLGDRPGDTLEAGPRAHRGRETRAAPPGPRRCPARGAEARNTWTSTSCCGVGEGAATRPKPSSPSNGPGQAGRAAILLEIIHMLDAKHPAPRDADSGSVQMQPPPRFLRA